MSVHTVIKILQSEECSQCHMIYAITKQFMKEKQENHTTFYCPQGHRQHYPGESEEQKLQTQLTISNHEIERIRRWLNQETRDHAVARHQRDTFKGLYKKTKRGLRYCRHNPKKV